MANFDESLFAHVSLNEVDVFIRNHVIDRQTLPLVESFAMGAVLGQAGSTIAEDLAVEMVPEFHFKDDVDAGNFFSIIDRRSLAWQPAVIPRDVEELIIGDLEKNRNLAEAKSVLLSAITHLQSNTEPLVVTKMRTKLITDVLEELKGTGVLTERHLSTDTLTAFNRHIKVEVRHVFGLLKAIMCRMKGDDIFRGRIPAGWDTMLSKQIAQKTKEMLRSQAGDILDTLQTLVEFVAIDPVLEDLERDKSLLNAIRMIEDDKWEGIPANLKMEHIGHVLLIAESLVS